MRTLSLDHLTVTDTTPSHLVEVAAQVGCRGVCMFLHPMQVLPAMPDFALIGDTPERRATRDAIRASGVAIDLVYPFTLTGRTSIRDFEPALETAAWLGARRANVLCYDRNPVRRIERLAELADLGARYDIGLAIEFYPPSQVRSLVEAFETVDAIANPEVGVTVDLLHLVRAGEMPGALASLSDPRINVAQFCDGPAVIGPDRLEWEAGIERKLPGEGAFDCVAFLRALAVDVCVSVEAPRQSSIDRRLPPLRRARDAVEAAIRQIIDAERGL